VRVSAIFLFLSLALPAHPLREDETSGNEQHDQRDWPERIAKSPPQPEKARYQKKRKEQRDKVLEEINQDNLPRVIRR
jgi:hypothetical protein